MSVTRLHFTTTPTGALDCKADPDGGFVHHADFQKRDELVRELVEALTTAKARVDELQMLMDEAFEAFGVTYGLCLRDYDPAAIAAVLAKAKAIDAEETRS